MQNRQPLFQQPASAIASNCSASYTIHLTVDVGPELTNRKDNVLIELRQGTVGHSKVVDKREFVGRSGTVIFSKLCASSYFIDIGNGAKVAVGPIHALDDNQHINTTVEVSFSEGNMGTMSRGDL